MKLRLIILPVSLAFITAMLLVFSPHVEETQMAYRPLPTKGDIAGNKMGEKEDDHKSARQAWFDLMHQTAPGQSWQQIEYDNQLRKQARRHDYFERDEVIIANGQISGTWYERGSNNQAGSVVATEYDPETDGIYLISADGSIFYGERDGSAWYVVNDKFRFKNRFLALMKHEEGTRMLAAPFGIPHYSDDYGLNWEKAIGISFNSNTDRWLGEGFKCGPENQVMIVPSKKSYWDNIWIYYSIDRGETYKPVFNLGTHDTRNFYLSKVEKNGALYMLVKANNTQSDLYQYDFENQEFDLVGTSDGLDLTDTRANIASVLTNEGIVRHYAYSKETDKVYKSEDNGNSWTETGDLPNNPWYKGLFVPSSAPDLVLTAGVELFRSSEQGANLSLVNHWWEYYDNVPSKLHADFMDIREFYTSDSIPFILLSNHGGLSITYDYTLNNQNIGMAGLNVSQYYDVVTDPTDHTYIYGGTQDQGWQKAFTFFTQDTPADFEQVTSGDYGHLTFSNNGEHMWMVYPGGAVSLWLPKSGTYLGGYTIDSDNESTWIPPMAESGYPEEDVVYVAGGNVNGGPGSHIIKLQYDGSYIEASQKPFDFLAASGAEVSAIEISKINPDIWYAATSNGKFFYSTDGGEDFTIANFNGPTPQYLYGSTIYASTLDDDVVYFGGSGYSSAGIYKSVDGGKTFSEMVNGLPQTLTYEITANEDESLLFAGTEAGPYVFVVEDQYWYDMSGLEAPTQRYWSAEFVSALNRVRFGTYGRGIFDFEIEQVNTAIKKQKHEVQAVLAPNPAHEWLNISGNLKASKALNVKILDVNGHRLIEDQIISDQEIFYKKIYVGNLNPGLYLLLLQDNQVLTTRQFIKI